MSARNPDVLNVRPATRSAQRGATLLVSLIMLMVITMFAVTGLNLSNVTLRIAGNAQEQRIVQASIQEAIEQVLSNSTLFVTGGAAQTATINGHNVTVTAPVCDFAVTLPGYSETAETAPEATFWTFQVSATDPLFGTSMTIHQGVRVPMLAGNCV
jgi:Tfp pilus assembly protein PilV